MAGSLGCGSSGDYARLLIGLHPVEVDAVEASKLNCVQKTGAGAIDAALPALVPERHVSQHRRHRPRFDHLPAVQHHHPAARLRDDADVMGDQEQGGAELGAQLLQLRPSRLSVLGSVRSASIARVMSSPVIRRRSSVSSGRRGPRQVRSPTRSRACAVPSVARLVRRSRSPICRSAARSAARAAGSAQSSAIASCRAVIAATSRSGRSK